LASLSPSSSSTPSPDQIPPLLSAELTFLFPLLVKFPKCYWIWNHRRWTLQQASAYLPQSEARRFWTDELGLVTKMLARDSRNFHGWGYRRDVVAELESERLDVPDGDVEGVQGEESRGWMEVGVEGEAEADGSSRTERAKDRGRGRSRSMSMVQSEFDYTTRMINTNLSNFSAWHSRSKLIPRLLDEQGADHAARRKMLDDGKYSPYSASPYPPPPLTQFPSPQKQSSSSPSKPNGPTPPTNPSGSTTRISSAPSPPPAPSNDSP
ncbi:MAG: hypothetical protein LQ340_008129, partial [Diploschistes diacapsis]